MVIYLPYPSLIQTVACLSDQHVRQQYVSCAQLVSILSFRPRGWTLSPLVRMWRYHPGVLQIHYRLLYFQCLARDIEVSKLGNSVQGPRTVLPIWFSDPRLHSSHRRVLLRRDFQHYSQFWPDVEPDTRLYWPEG